ncbi:MAG TPA: PAS domain S-box protein [Methanoculleus sp.]|nr:PAS domain S-box protein [Methanoculleus sp.]
MDGGVCEVNTGAHGSGDRMAGRPLPLEGEVYYSVFCSNPVPMAVLDLDGRALESNAAARRVLLADESIQCSTGAEDSAGEEHLLEHLLRSAWRGDGGDTIRFKIERTPLIWKGNEATLLTFHDQTELRDLRRSLKQQETRLYLALRGARVGTWMASLSDHTISVDDQWAAMIGYDARELGTDIREAFFSHVHPADRKRMTDYAQCLGRGNPAPMDIEFRMLHRNGQDVWIRSMGHAISSEEDGAPGRIAGVHIDITREHASRDALFEANRKLSILSSITRHDIMNELSVILMCEDLMAMDGLPEEGSKYNDYLELIFRATKTIERQILFTRDYEEMGIGEPAWNRVCTLSGRAVRLLCPEGVTIHVQKGNVEVYADPMFVKVLYSIFENALRHGKGVTEITVSFTERDGAGVLMVRDNGRGVAQAEKTRIFERGYGENTGYGLFLSREILSLTGITIDECGIPGEGACFEMEIPPGRFRYPEEGEAAAELSGFDDVA